MKLKNWRRYLKIFVAVNLINFFLGYTVMGMPFVITFGPVWLYEKFGLSFWISMPVDALLIWIVYLLLKRFTVSKGLHE